MTKPEILAHLRGKDKKLFNFLKNQDISKWDKGPEGKWTTGQQVLHLVQSAMAINKGLGAPKLILRYKFGKSNRTPRPYEAIIKRYHERLEGIKGITFGPSKNMRIPAQEEKEQLIAVLESEHKKLQEHVQKWSDKSLDKLLLPHPAMGRMPVREFVMWAGYHVEHHTKSLEENYN